MCVVLGRLNLNFHRAFGVHTRIGLLSALRLYRVRSVLNHRLERSLVGFAFLLIFRIKGGISFFLLPTGLISMVQI